MSTLIRGLSHVVTFDSEDRELANADILVDGTVIVAVGHDLSDAGVDEVIDGSGLIALPGLINAHQHLWEVVLRCPPDLERVTAADWMNGTSKLSLRLWKAGKLGPDEIGRAVRAIMLESLLSGVTTIADQHLFFPEGSAGSYIESIIEAAQSIGIRLHVARSSKTLGKESGGFAADPFIEKIDDVTAHCVELIERWHDPSPSGMIRVAVGPVGLHSDRPEMFTEAVRLADSYDGVRLHTHLYQQVDTQVCKRLYGKTPWEKLKEFGWADDRVWIGHGNDVPHSEIPEFAAAGIGVAPTIASDLKFGWGLPPVRQYLDQGVTLGFATTGSGGSNDGANLLGDLRVATLAHRLATKDPERWPTVRDFLGMATRGSAACLGRNELGSLEPGKIADIACWDTRRLDRVGAHDPVAALIMTGISDTASLVLINGKVLVKDGEPTRVDPQRVAEDAWSVIPRLS